jgi:hypothetical protein
MPTLADGRNWAFSTKPGTGIQDQLPNSAGSSAYTRVVNGSLTNVSLDTSQEVANEPNKLWYLLAILALVIVLKFAMEHDKMGMEPSFIGIGVYNYLAIGLMSMLFIIPAKTLANIYYVPGLSEVISLA